MLGRASELRHCPRREPSALDGESEDSGKLNREAFQATMVTVIKLYPVEVGYLWKQDLL